MSASRAAGQRLFARVALALASLVAGSGCSDGEEPERRTLRVGVLVPLSGEEDFEWRRVLDHTAREIQRAGGVAGRDLELVYADTAADGITTAARELLEDEFIVAVVGASNTADLEAIAPRFIREERVLVSPAATSEEVFKAFGGKEYIWRTVESDAGQLEAMFAVAREGEARSAALLTAWDDYGSTFFNWFGFLAYESGIDPVGIVRYESGPNACTSSVEAALEAHPDVLFAVALHVDVVTCIVREARRVAPETRVIFSDGANLPTLPMALGAAAEGVEGLVPAEDPEFELSLGDMGADEPVPPFAANVHDALLLLAYGLSASNGEGGPALARALARVVDARGEKVGSPLDLGATLRAVGEGRSLDIAGASGPLDFDLEFHTDPVAGFYKHWRLEDGQFVDGEYYFTGVVGEEHGALRRVASDALRRPLQDQAPPALDRDGVWALILATSSGWENYRHQADALAQYQLLRASGLDDDRIVLIIADDLAADPRNPRPGVVEDRVQGDDLRSGARIDYSPQALTPGDVLDILRGRASETLPTVLHSGPADNIYVYIAGHGGQDGISLNATNPREVSASVLTPQALDEALNAMHTEGRYRQIFLAVEACHAGVLGEALTAPDALLLAAATPYENSVSTNYRPADGSWLADQFSFELTRAAAERQGITILELYVWTYQRVAGSHVTLYNHQRFQGSSTAPFADFVTP